MIVLNGNARRTHQLHDNVLREVRVRVRTSLEDASSVVDWSNAAEFEVPRLFRRLIVREWLYATSGPIDLLFLSTSADRPLTPLK